MYVPVSVVIQWYKHRADALQFTAKQHARIKKLKKELEDEIEAHGLTKARVEENKRLRPESVTEKSTDKTRALTRAQKKQKV